MDDEDNRAEVVLARARIEPGKEDRLRAWVSELHDCESEVETLQHEGADRQTKPETRR